MRPLPFSQTSAEPLSTDDDDPIKLPSPSFVLAPAPSRNIIASGSLSRAHLGFPSFSFISLVPLMRSILLQTRRASSRSLLLPQFPSPSPLPRRSNASLPSSGLPSTTPPPTGPSSSSHPSLSEPSTSPSSPLSLTPSTSRPPPPLRVPSSSSSPTGPASSRPKGAPKSLWLSQRQVDNHRAKTRALAERLQGEGSEGVVGTPEVVKAARNIFKAARNLLHVGDNHLRSICIIYHAISTSPTAENDYGRQWIRSTLVRLLLLFTRRSNPNPKSDFLVPSLRLLVQDASNQDDLEIRKEDFRTIIVDLASGATNASEAVEIVEGLRRLSPSSFTESQFEEALQAISRVEDWTTTTRNTFQLPSFPPSIEPLYQPPLSTSARPSKTPATPKPPKPKSPRPPSTISPSPSPSTSPSPAEEIETSLTPSPPPPSPKDLLEFSRTLSAVPSPSTSTTLLPTQPKSKRSFASSPSPIERPPRTQTINTTSLESFHRWSSSSITPSSSTSPPSTWISRRIFFLSSTGWTHEDESEPSCRRSTP
ncbi:hypothetical protein BDY24DRAFT_370338 [Mrakia frigida]|uniref:uncharacterized protein n=1 Tax=Mrakia frigida TaxID=29902 RepID=UPI003FCC231E